MLLFWCINTRHFIIHVQNNKIKYNTIKYVKGQLDEKVAICL